MNTFLVQINIIKLWIKINNLFKRLLTHVDCGVGNVINNNVYSYIKCFIGKPILGWYHLEPPQQVELIEFNFKKNL
jgi:hypothetical protein